MAPSGLKRLSAADIQNLAADNPGPCTLYRADTHGTETAIIANVSEDFAASVLNQFERGTHHQGYWIRVPEHAP